ncbi:MAG: hypothetical protein JSW33_03490 [bacterium]|nr:MAG: hypothetical protein JSW33_03490 [bacterium]
MTSKYRKNLQKISKRLTTHQLRRLPEKDLELGYNNLFMRDEKQPVSPYFLGYYSPEGVRYALESYGFFETLHKIGYKDLDLVVDTQDPYRQRIAVYYDHKDPQHLLGEVVVKKKHITPYPPFPSLIYGRNFEVISIEWLCMQNPLANFNPDKPRLPGQKYPGLGMGAMIMEILVIMCGRLRTAGLLNVPEHFHNAQMYSGQFMYLDPDEEARRLAIARDLLGHCTLSQASWAIDLGCVRENDKAFKWHGSDQIIALDRDLKEYIQSKDYKRQVKEQTKNFHYVLDQATWAQKASEIEDAPTCP